MLKEDAIDDVRSKEQINQQTPETERLAPDKLPLQTQARSALLDLIEARQPGDSLPTYPELAAQLRCSLAPIKQAMQELKGEGRVSLRRGRRAQVLWNNSFSRSAREAGRSLKTMPFELAYRRLEPREQTIGRELGLERDQQCIICGRIRRLDGRPVAMQTAYINPAFFADPARFFLDHDVVSGSLGDVYPALEIQPLSVTAGLKVGLADARERDLMSLQPDTPVLRSHQRTVVEYNGQAVTLEVMNATYTQEIEYTVERLPRWNEPESF